MEKYMLTVQHDNQKVAYIEFKADSDEQAKEQGKKMFSEYESQPVFTPRFPSQTGNFSGLKPRIKHYHVCKWNQSATAVNAWGVPCGGYWSNI